MRRRQPVIVRLAAARAVAETLSTEPRLLEVIRLGHPVLRQTAEPVPESWFDSGRLVDLGEALVRTMLEEQGVGLAAPQVAEGLRLFAYWVPADDDGRGIPPTVIANPELRVVGDDVEEDWEGCLSIPGLRGVVPRHARIKLKGRGLDGTPLSVTADGFHARVIQHEYDHLDGVVFLDRMTDTHSLTFEREWETYMLGIDGG
jgi:peptide deformylase